MPTVSAAQALSDLKSSPSRVISTGVPQLDSLLQNQDASASSHDAGHGGVSRGQVTEIYGPPGVGKTAIGYVGICKVEVLSLIAATVCS